MKKDSRFYNYKKVSENLINMNDADIMNLIHNTKDTHVGTGGQSSNIQYDDVKLFIKKIPLTEFEMKKSDRFSTRNIFKLPMYFHYGIGSIGFNAWRELSAHIQSSNWVLNQLCLSFPLLYHWRIVPDPHPKILPNTLESYKFRILLTDYVQNKSNRIGKNELGIFLQDNLLFIKSAYQNSFGIEKDFLEKVHKGAHDRVVQVIKDRMNQKANDYQIRFQNEDKNAILEYASLRGYIPSKLDRLATYWGENPHIRKRFEERENAKFSLVLFLEHIPFTLENFLNNKATYNKNISKDFIITLEKQIESIVYFLKWHKFVHFDATFKNILTDGSRLYLTDFGLANSFSFDLGEVEFNFLKAHLEFDSFFTKAALVDWLGSIIVGRPSFRSEFETIITKNEYDLIPSAMRDTIIRNYNHWIEMNRFFDEIVEKVNLRSDILIAKSWKKTLQALAK